MFGEDDGGNPALLLERLAKVGDPTALGLLRLAAQFGEGNCAWNSLVALADMEGVERPKWLGDIEKNLAEARRRGPFTAG